MFPISQPIYVGLSVAFAAAKINQGLNGSQKVKGDTPPVARLPPGVYTISCRCITSIHDIMISIHPIQTSYPDIL